MDLKDLITYVDYIRNAGRATLPVSVFDDDWAPVGPAVRKALILAGLATECDGAMTLTSAVLVNVPMVVTLLKARDQPQHTPGPWCAHHDRTKLKIRQAPSQRDHGVHVANVVRLDKSLEEHEANARLLASAPNGYALAAELIRGGGDAESLQRAIDLARKLISEVEGA